ncbi:MAG: C2H2-type zinc finger protein [Nitrososphaerota archaeon]|nr:C2H2-type zinc finger protein [Nitrososphaerota archaeon]MDG6975088.1 C2H2-type zinc finger protein [Nitrososphaerota archaeon]
MPEFKCQACGAAFPEQEALMQHNASAHPMPHAAQALKCEGCGASFDTQAELQAHSQTAHRM